MGDSNRTALAVKPGTETAGEVSRTAQESPASFIGIPRLDLSGGWKSDTELNLDHHLLFIRA